jgi:hypothetical protein
MDKVYDSKKYEDSIYQSWIEAKIGLFETTRPSLQKKIKNPNTVQHWELNFRSNEIISEILEGSKTIETRALNPEEPDRFFGEIKPRDIVILHDIKNKRRYFYEVLKTEIYTDLNDAYQKNLDFKSVNPSLNQDSSFEDINNSYLGRLGKDYIRKIEENGLVAIYLGRKLDPKHNDLDWEELLNKPKLTTFIMPPPNLTGSLHLGHVMEHSIYDTYLRYNLMQGNPAVFLPGVDHAGIQFEGTIEKNLKKQGLSKEEIGFDEFIKQSWEFATSSKDNIKQIAASIGELPAWDKMHFTMDDASIAAVRGAFFDYWQRGWVYKGTQMVNWSVGLQTAVSEVFGDIEWEERKDPFVTFEYEACRYEIEESNLHTPNFQTFLHDFLLPMKLWPRLKLSTVRMETKFTDLAVAMHPSKFNIYFNLEMFDKQKPGFDENLANDFIEAVKQNKIEVFYHLPALKSDELKLILSDKVLADFGTGIVKITPAHDPFDYQLYLEFIEAGLLDKNAEIKQAVGRDGKLTAVCGEYAGLTVEEARPRIIKKLIETGYIPNKVKQDA